MRTTASDSEREALQRSVDSKRSQQERNDLGQFATPTALAHSIAKTALAYSNAKRIRFLDPACGLGALYAALIAVAGATRVEWARGVEIDRTVVRSARTLFSPSELSIKATDFTRLAAPRAAHARANLILANPPYVRHHAIEKGAKLRLKADAEAMLRRSVSGLSGLYVYFLLRAHAFMARGAVAAWLVPAEWMDVNYGGSVREYLTKHVTLLRVHRFEAGSVQFDDALVTSTVVFLRNEPPREAESFELTSGPLEAPRNSVRVARATAARTQKWGTLVSTLGERRAGNMRLGDIFEVKRGVATGCNRLFVRPRAEFLDLAIPPTFLRPVLSRSRELGAGTVERLPDGYPDLPSPLALLDCRHPESALRETAPALYRYFRSPEAKAAAAGYLARRRHPWYAQEQRDHAPIIATYMGRSRKGTSPIRFFWNRSDAIATNAYLMLIPRAPYVRVFRNAPTLVGEFVGALRDKAFAEISEHGRVYGGGLHKLEPRELARVDVTAIVESLRLRPCDEPAGAGSR